MESPQKHADFGRVRNLEYFYRHPRKQESWNRNSPHAQCWTNLVFMRKMIQNLLPVCDVNFVLGITSIHPPNHPPIHPPTHPPTHLLTNLSCILDRTLDKKWAVFIIHSWETPEKANPWCSETGKRMVCIGLLHSVTNQPPDIPFRLPLDFRDGFLMGLMLTPQVPGLDFIRLDHIA